MSVEIINKFLPSVAPCARPVKKENPKIRIMSMVDNIKHLD